MPSLPDFIPLSVIQELYGQGADDFNMTLYLMGRYSGKFVEDLEDEVWTEETLNLLEEVQTKLRGNPDNIHGLEDGSYSLTLQHPVNGEQVWTFNSPKIGDTLKNPPAPSGNPGLDDFNFQIIMLARLSGKSEGTIRQMAACDFNGAGAILSNFTVFQRLRKVATG